MTERMNRKDRRDNCMQKRSGQEGKERHNEKARTRRRTPSNCYSAIGTNGLRARDLRLRKKRGANDSVVEHRR